MTWFSLRKPATTLVLAASEAVWLSLCASALANTTKHFQMDVPYLALALPILASTAIALLLAHRLLSNPVRIAIALLGAVVITAIGAGLVSSLSVPQSFSAVAFHPWSITTRVPSVTAALSWFFVSVAASRGVLLGLAPPTFAQSIRSVVIGSLAFFALFLAIARSDAPALHRATHTAEALFIIYFVAVLMLLRLARARDYEGAGSAIMAGGSPGVWLALLAGPLVVVAVLAIALALGLNSWGTAFGHGFIAAVHGVGFAFSETARGLSYCLVKIFTGVAYVILAFIHLFWHASRSANTVVHAPTTTTLARGPQSIHPPLGAVIALAVFVVIAVVLVLRRIARSLRREHIEVAPHRYEEKHFVFSLRALLRRVLQLLLAPWRWLLARFARSQTSSTAESQDDAPPIRREFKRLLVHAQNIGYGRATTETAAEYGLRLSVDLQIDTVAGIVEQYERVRYSSAASEIATADFASEIDLLIEKMQERFEADANAG